MAKAADAKVLEPYFSHPSHYIIDNLGTPSGFKTKLGRCLDVIKQIVGYPYKEGFKKRFLIAEGIDVVGKVKSEGILFDTQKLELHMLKGKGEFLTKLGNINFTQYHIIEDHSSELKTKISSY